jgi:hypothetical protein
VLIAVAVAAFPPAASARPTAAPDALSLFGVRGAWLDIFAGATWGKPAQVIASLRAHGVATLYLQTGNYSQRTEVVRPRILGRWLEGAHAAGIAVVAWYLPALVDPRLDARRALAAINYRSAAGDRFDGFALDIEASIEPLAHRNENLLALAAKLRSAAPSGYPLGAIIPSPVGMERHPHYWPGFPYRRLATSFDAFLPMAYFSYYVHTPSGAYSYTERVVSLLRRRTSATVLIHLIGGLANRLSAPAVAAFARAADACKVSGVSLYAYAQTSSSQWAALDAHGVSGCSGG